MSLFHLLSTWDLVLITSIGLIQVFLLKFLEGFISLQVDDSTWGKRRINELVEKLETALALSNRAFSDAVGKKLSDLALKELLDHLHDAISDARQLMDRVDAEVLRRKMREFLESRNGAVQVLIKCIPPCVTLFDESLRNMIQEILDKIVCTETDKYDLRLKVGVRIRSLRERPLIEKKKYDPRKEFYVPGNPVLPRLVAAYSTSFGSLDLYSKLKAPDWSLLEASIFKRLTPRPLRLIRIRIKHEKRRLDQCRIKYVSPLAFVSTDNENRKDEGPWGAGNHLANYSSCVVQHLPQWPNIQIRKISYDDLRSLYSQPMPSSAFMCPFARLTQIPLHGLTDLILPKYLKELINEESPFEVYFPYSRIPELCSNWNMESSIKMKLPLEETSTNNQGIALFIIGVSKKQTDLDDIVKAKNIVRHFCIDGYRILKPVFLESTKQMDDGPLGIWCYVPREWFAGWFNTACYQIEASISTNRVDVELKKYGVHLISEQDVEEFSQNLAQTAYEHQDPDLNFERHCKQLLDEASKLENIDDVISTGHSKVTLDEEEQDCTWENISSAMLEDLRKKTESLLSKLYERSYALKNRFYFVLPIRTFPTWFFHHSVGDVALCHVSSDLYHDERWIGLELYAELIRRPSLSSGNLNEENSLVLDLYAHGTRRTEPVMTYPLIIDGRYGYNCVICHVPRQCFTEFLNHCQGITALFRPMTCDLEVEMCGTRLLYDNDSASLIKEIIEPTLKTKDGLSILHDQAEMYLEDKTAQRNAVERKMPRSGLFSLLERERIEYSRMITTLARKTFLKPVFLHSKKNWYCIKDTVGDDTSRGYLTTGFHSVHVMADTVLNARTDSVRRERNVKFTLEKFLKKHRFLVFLSLKGRIISVLKSFDPYSTYNFCFPRKEILGWFEHQSPRFPFTIQLPLDLRKGKNWKGLVICAAFEVEERHPTDFSETSFKILCHLTTGGRCLDPVSMFSITKEELKTWSHLGGFIWLTYLPVVLLTELNGGSFVTARIFSDCQGLKVQRCGIGLLYKEGVEDFKRTITRSWTSFLDNLKRFHLLAAEYDNDHQNSSQATEAVTGELASADVATFAEDDLNTIYHPNGKLVKQEEERQDQSNPRTIKHTRNFIKLHSRSRAFKHQTSRQLTTGNKSTRQNSKTPRVVCQLCDKPGHTAKDCFSTHGFPRISATNIASTSGTESELPGWLRRCYMKD